VDVEGYIDQLAELVAQARPVPMSSAVKIDRERFEQLLDELREQLPEELRQSRWVVKERDDLLAQAGRASDRILADARAEQERLVSGDEVVRVARREADRIVEEAREQARVLRLEAEDYVDGKLERYEEALRKTLATAEEGRKRLRTGLNNEERSAAVGDPTDEAASPGEGSSTAGSAQRRRDDRGGSDGPGAHAAPSSSEGADTGEGSLNPQLFDHEADSSADPGRP
jgi:cell division septum initiation protein DivIVA